MNISFIFVLLLAVVFPSDEIHAFSCEPTTLDDQINDADTIVAAVLVEAHVVDETFRMSSATFKVHEVLKGKLSDRFTIQTSTDLGTGSGVPLTIGRHYILFFRQESRMVNSCNGTGFYSQGRLEEIKVKLREK